MKNIKLHHFFNNIGGLNLHANMNSLSDSEAEDITNLHLTGQGSWSSRNVGYTTVTDTPLNDGEQITGTYRFARNADTAHMVVAAGSKVYEFDLGTGTGTEIGSGFTPGRRVNFTTFQNFMILCNGAEAPMKWTGSGQLTELDGWVPSIPGITPGLPAISEVFANRLIFAGDGNNPSLLYISALESPEDFTPSQGAASAGAIQVSPGDGQAITALKILYLPIENEEVLVIFKERSIYLLTGHDADTFALQKVTSAFGAVSHQSVVMLGGDLMFLSEEGISTLSTTTLQGSLAAGLVSHKVLPQFAGLNRQAMTDSFAVHLPHRQEIWWFVPEGSSAQNQLVLVYNYRPRDGVWSRRTGITASCGVVVNGRLYTGTYDGHIHRQLDGNSYAGAAVTWRYRTPFYALGTPRIRKRIREVELYMTQLANTSFTLRSGWDGVRTDRKRQSRTVAVTLDSQSSLYGSATYGVDSYDAAGVCRRQLMLHGSGRRLQLEFAGMQTTLPVELQGWIITTIEGGL